MKKTEKQKQELIKELWYNRNPCHENDQSGVDRFWGTVLCVLDDYNKALTLPVVVGKSEQLKAEQEAYNAGYNEGANEAATEILSR